MKGLQNIYRRFLSILGAGVLTMVIAFIATPIIVRLLDPSGYGDYAVVLSIFSLYMIPVSSGITLGVQKYVSEDRDNPHWQEHVIRFYTLLAFATVFLGVVVMIAFTALGGAAYFFSEEFTLYLYLLSGLVLVAQFRGLSDRILLGMSLELLSGPLSVILKFFTVGLGILFVLSGLHVEGMIAGHIIANLVVVCLATYWIAKRISLKALLESVPDSFPHRTILFYNGFNIVLVVLVSSLYHVDIIMLRILSDSETTGFYKAAIGLAEYLWIAPIALKTVLLHSSSTLWSNNRIETITEMSARVTRYTILLTVLMGIGLAVLSTRFVPLYYGEAFSVAVTPLLLLLPGAIGFAGARPLKSISQGSGKMKVLIAATAVAAAANLILNATLIPLFGMNGAAVATSISYGSMFFLFVWAAWKIGYDPLDDFRAPRIAGTAILAAPVIWFTNRMIAYDIVAFIVVPVVGGVAFGIAALATGAIDKTDLDPALERLPDPIRNVLYPMVSRVDEL